MPENTFTLSPALNKNKVFLLQKSKVEKRLDPDYYHLERRFEIDRLKQSKHLLRSLKLTTSFPKIILSENPDNLPYIGLEDIESNTGTYFNNSEKENFGTALYFKAGNVLFPKLRPYLNKVHLAEFDGICSTEFVILDSNKVSPEFLSAFLRSSIVVNQTKHMMSGNTLPRLQTDDIKNILVPIADEATQNKVVSIMKLAFEQKKQNESATEKLLYSIDDYLLKELGITLPAPLENILRNRIYTTTIKEISGGRFDPKLYSPQTKALLKSLLKTKYEFQTLKAMIVHSTAGDWGLDENEKVTENEYVKCLVLRATEFDNKFNLNVEGSRAKYRLINKIKLTTLDIQTDDLIIEKSGGSIDQPVGRIAIINKELTNNYTLCFSNFVHKIRVDQNIIYPEFVFNYLKTIHNIKITDVMQSQTNGIRNLILSEYFNLPIPIPPLTKQQEIAEHITEIRKQAQQLKDKTKEALEKAGKEIESILLSPKKEIL